MKRRCGQFLLLAAVLTSRAGSAATAGEWLDRSHEIFLPPQLNAVAANYRDFPLFWWDFILVDGRTRADQVCEKLAATSDLGIRKLPCHFQLKDLRPLAADWAGDLPKRQPVPSEKDLARQLNTALAKASLPMGRDLLELLRLDPLDSLARLKTLISRRMRMDSDLQDGILVDPKNQLVLLPLQFDFSPADTVRSKLFSDRLASWGTDLRSFGAHASTLENEQRIRADVDLVGVLGPLALLVLAAFLLITRRARVLNLVPLLLFAIAVAAGVTILLFGKIHGITLAFGPGIIGLAMDYGIHSCFLGARSAKTWRANWVGIWTTIVVLILLGFSSIPLLRQMMFFATFGICFSYLLFRVVLRRWPQWFEVPPYRFSPRRWPRLGWVAAALLVAPILLLFRHVDLSVQHLNYESAQTIQSRKSFAALAGSDSPYLSVEDAADPLTSSLRHKAWAEKNAIAFEGVADYLPPTAAQEGNLGSWRRRFCSGHEPRVDARQGKFFAPFWQGVECARLRPVALSAHVPQYLADFTDRGRFVGLFFPRDEAAVAKLRREFPAVSTPREIFDRFPHLLYAELLWMIPLGLMGALFFLWLHYRAWRDAWLAVVPFFTGLGLYALAVTAFNLPVSFISLIGLLMVFGCSLDYGVFVVDFLLYRDQDHTGVWSALSLCAFATVSGFAPLVFAHHPVLNDLGQALLWGTLGTYIGSLWGITALHRLRLRRAA